MTFAGCITGTYAWYEYESRVKMGYSGTTVSEDQNIDIGLISDKSIPNFDIKYQLTKDTTSIPGKYIYWSSNSQLTSACVMEYENFNGNASNSMSPTSSSTYSTGGTFSLKTSPVYLAHDDENAAKPEEYSRLCLALKDGNDISDFFLKDSTIKCENSIHEAVRVHFEDMNDSSTNFIFNPSSVESGVNDVGGILNLNLEDDDVYDYDKSGDYEYIYGKVDNLTYSEERYDGSKQYDPSECNSFLSNHKKGLRKVSYTAQKAQYIGRKDTLLTRRIAKSNPQNNIAEVEVVIYLEGWDLKCIDSGLFYKYSLSLDFMSKKYG